MILSKIKGLICRMFLFSLLIGIIPVETDIEAIYNANNAFARIEQQGQHRQQQDHRFFRLSPYLKSNPPIEIIKSEPHFLLLRFRLTHLNIELVNSELARTHQLNGQSATKIQFAGSSWTTESGKPKLPVYSVQIGLPAASSVTTTIIDKQSSFKTLETPPLTNQEIDPSPEFNNGSNGTDVQDKTKHADTLASSSSSILYPSKLVEVLPIGFVRSQRIGILHINPVQYNSTTRQIKVTDDMTFRIDFFGSVQYNGTAASTSLPLHSLDSPVYENMFRSILINNKQASQWRHNHWQQQMRSGHAPNIGPMAPAAPLITPRRRFKIPITENNMYRITHTRLVASGIEPASIDFDSIRIETGGNQQGFYIFDIDNDETFDPEDKIVFYARGLVGNKFTNTNYYWFSFVPKGAVEDVDENTYRVGTRSASPSPDNVIPPKAFLTKKRFEEENFYDPLDGRDVRSELADHYFWTAFRGGADSNLKRKQFPVQLPGAINRHDTEEDATVRIKLQGSSRRSNVLHRAVIIFNNNQLGDEETWRRQGNPLVIRDIPQAKIDHSNVNYLLIVANDTNDTPEGSYDFYLDWYEFEYWHTFRAIDNRLEFNSKTDPDTIGTTQFNVNGFSNDSIDVYAISLQAGIKQKLVDGLISGSANNYQIRFEDEIKNHTNYYFAIANNAYKTVSNLTEIPQSSLRNDATQTDYIVITHSTFLERIQPLVAFRRSQGLTVRVVDIDEIYNEYSHGLFNPFAIRTFLRDAYHSWQPPAPTYVLLVGDAHHDYKRVIVERYKRDPNFNRVYDLYPNFVPTYHGWAPESGETAMDQRFVNIVGSDSLPDMFIGRLSVQTTQELDIIVQKIMNYEQKPIIGPWQATLTQIADNEVDNPSDIGFELSRDELIKDIIPLGYRTKQIYLRKIERADTARGYILNAFKDGTIVMEYAGHGGNQTWADEGIFHINDIDKLRNNRLPFVISTTCLNGEFDKPQQYGKHSLSEQFLHGKYGAIASLSATRLTYAPANAEFDTDLFTTMFEHEPFEQKQGISANSSAWAATPATLGKIVTEAKIRFLTRTTNPQWVPGAEQYTLFGDPATQLALPTLDLKVKLEEVALNPSKQIVILNNEAGIHDVDGTWWKAEEFSTENLIASAIFYNDFDENIENDFTAQTSGKIWKGEYGTIRMNIPSKALPGRGVVSLFADDGKRAAVGGTVFWVDTPIIENVREILDSVDTHTFNIQTLVYDDLGGNGIRSVEVEWDDTFNYRDVWNPMIKIDPPSGTSQFRPGGQWYELKDPIPLPRGGYKIRYRIEVTDINGFKSEYPGPNKRIEVRAPQGPNLKIAADGSTRYPIQYTYNDKTKEYAIIAELVNNGGRTVKTGFDVIFAEGNPDIDGDFIVDSNGNNDAKIIGTITLQPDDWEEGETVLQKTVVRLTLPENLATGVHEIFVMLDPEVDTSTKDIIGSVIEYNERDNKSRFTFVVNEYFYNPSQPLTAYSLDRVFNLDFPAAAAATEGELIPLNVSSSAPYSITQPSLSFATIPQVAALRRGVIRTGEERLQQYDVSIQKPDFVLQKPVTLKLRFDISSLEDIVRENTPWHDGSRDFQGALIDEAEKLGIYAWNKEYEKWRRLPSQVAYTTGDEKPTLDTEGPIFELENYVTPIQTDNGNKQPLPIENVKISPELTPAGTWVILFLDPTHFEVYLKEKEHILYEKFDTAGQLDIPYRIENYGMEFTITENWIVPPELNDGSPIVPFEFADILVIETDYSAGAAILKKARNKNAGNGTATVEVKLGTREQFAVGDWFIFFTSETRFELRDRTGEPLYLPNDVLIDGRVNEIQFLNHLGIEILVKAGSEPFEFGDKIKFSTAQVGTITAETTELTPFTLISNEDNTEPDFELWIDGVKPQKGSVIAPRPYISILLEDENGVDLDTFVIRRGDNGKPLEPISEYILRNPKDVNTVPIDYKPILFPGEYAFEIEARDFNGNAIGGKAAKIQTQFLVTEMPDIIPPVIEITVNDEMLIGTEWNFVDTGADSLGELPVDRIGIGKNRITQQPRCEIRVTDETALDISLLNITFNKIMTDDAEGDVTQRYREFASTIFKGAEWEYNNTNPGEANFSFDPDLPNGTYRLQVTAADTSENTTQIEADFTLDETVGFQNQVFNVPNPVPNGKTDFIYQLTQPPDKVTIKIYTASGRLIRTIVDDSAKRGNNETFWDLKDETGTRCANGVYLYRVIAHTGNNKVEKIGKLAILR